MERSSACSCASLSKAVIRMDDQIGKHMCVHFYKILENAVSMAMTWLKKIWASVDALAPCQILGNMADAMFCRYAEDDLA